MNRKPDEKIAGFDRDLIEKMLSSCFRYERDIDSLKREDDGMVVRLYNSELDVSVVKPDYFRLKHIVVQNYRTNRGDRPVIEMTDRGRELSIVGYRMEDKND